MMLCRMDAEWLLKTIRECDKTNKTFVMELNDGTEVDYDGTQIVVSRYRHGREPYSCVADFAESYGFNHEGSW